MTRANALGADQGSAMATGDCDGWVQELRGQSVTFTGRVSLDGRHVSQPKCAALAARRRGQSFTDFSLKVTLVVRGELAGQQVADAGRGYSDELIAVAHAQIGGGRHVHVVDSAGFGGLLAGTRARCQALRAGRVIDGAGGGRGGPGKPPDAGDDALGGPLRTRKVVSRQRPSWRSTFPGWIPAALRMKQRSASSSPS